jgi:hypothetical protein
LMISVEDIRERTFSLVALINIILTSFIDSKDYIICSLHNGGWIIHIQRWIIELQI